MTMIMTGSAAQFLEGDQDMETIADSPTSLIFCREKSRQKIDISLAWLWTLLFGPLYFLWHNNYAHAGILFGIFFLPCFLLKDAAETMQLGPAFETFRVAAAFMVLAVYSIFARRIMRKHYEKEGWTPCE
jgi:hypothetical protein